MDSLPHVNDHFLLHGHYDLRILMQSVEDIYGAGRDQRQCQQGDR